MGSSLLERGRVGIVVWYFLVIFGCYLLELDVGSLVLVGGEFEGGLGLFEDVYGVRLLFFGVICMNGLRFFEVFRFGFLLIFIASFLVIYFFFLGFISFCFLRLRGVGLFFEGFLIKG